jgi:hypothetical protein
MLLRKMGMFLCDYSAVGVQVLELSGVALTQS